MRTQMLRRLGPLIARGGAVGRHSAVATTEADGATGPSIGHNQREYAEFLLSMAAEIEHSLMIQYLYNEVRVPPALPGWQHEFDISCSIPFSAFCRFGAWGCVASLHLVAVPSPVYQWKSWLNALLKEFNRFPKQPRIH